MAAGGDGELEEYERWEPVERRLRSIIVRAVEGTELADDPRFVASVTEQEVVRGSLTVPDAGEHVFCGGTPLSTGNSQAIAITSART